MSSIAQYKEALKRQRQIVYDLKKENVFFQEELKKMSRKLLDANRKVYDLTNKKWWQFWK